MSTDAAFLASIGRNPARPFATALPATRGGRLRSSLPSKVLESRLRAEYDALVSSWESQRRPAAAAMSHGVDECVGASAPGAGLVTPTTTNANRNIGAAQPRSRRLSSGNDATRPRQRPSQFHVSMTPPVFDALHILAVDAAAATDAAAPDVPPAAKVLRAGAAAASAALRAERAAAQGRRHGSTSPHEGADMGDDESTGPPAGIVGPEEDVSIAARRLQPATGVDLEAALLAHARDGSASASHGSSERGTAADTRAHRTCNDDEYARCRLLSACDGPSRATSARATDAIADAVADAVRREIERQNHHYARAVAATATGGRGVATAKAVRRTGRDRPLSTVPPSSLPEGGSSAPASRWGAAAFLPLATTGGRAASVQQNAASVGRRTKTVPQAHSRTAATRDFGVSPLAPPKSFVPPAALGSLAMHRNSVSRHRGGSLSAAAEERVAGTVVMAPRDDNPSRSASACGSRAGAEWRARRRELLDALSACLFRRGDPEPILAALRENAKSRGDG